MKNLKNLLFTLMFICLTFSFYKVEAISEELINENDNITFPSIIWSTGSKITVYNTENYDLYAQFMEITEEKHIEISDNSDKVKKLVKEANAYISENRPNKDDYETDEEYNDVLNIYSNKVKDYDNQIKNLKKEYYDSIPDFDDTKWEKLTDDTVYLPKNLETKPFVLFIKLDDKQNSIVDYEFGVLKLDNKTNEDDDIPADEPNDNQKEDPELKEPNSNTGDVSIIAVAGTMLICGFVSVVAYKKVRNN